MINHPEAVEVPREPQAASSAAAVVKVALHKRPSPRHQSYRWIWLLLLVGAGFFAYRSYQQLPQKDAVAVAVQEREAADLVVSISAAAARRGDLPIYERGLGNVQAYATVNVKTRVDGPIVKVLFREGQFVKQGDVLMQIDPRTYQAAVYQAVGKLARDQAQLNDARVNLGRYQKLWDDQVIAKQQLDTQAAQVGQFEGAIEADKANIETAKLNLSFTNITAPVSGRIGPRQVDIGHIIHATDGQALAVIKQMQPVAVVFTLPAGDFPPVLAKLRAGVTLTVLAYDRADRNHIATGTLETVDNPIDPTTGTSRLKAIFPNQDNALFPQQFVNCRLLLDARHGVVLIPVAAVETGPQGPYVYVVTAGHTATMLPITEGVTEGSEVEVTRGIAPGEVVVTDGQDKLHEGSRVQVLNHSGDLRRP